MGVYALKPAFRRGLAPFVRIMMRFHPNTISAFSILFAGLAGALLYVAPQRDWFYLVVPLLLLLRIACNALDGMVAQRRGLGSPTGEMVNEFSDRINDTLVFAGLALSGATHASWVWGALAAVLLVSYLGILPRAAGGSRRFEGPFGKADRMLLLSLFLFAAFAAPRVAWPPPVTGLDAAGTVLLVAMATFILLAVLTVANRWRRAWRELGGTG